MRRVILLIILLVIIASPGFSSPNGNKHNHHHGHGRWELGVALGGVYLLNEDEFALGMHFHVLRRLDGLQRLNIGLGFETVFDEHTHFNSSIVFKYDIWKGLSGLVSPGVLLLKHDNSWERHFSTHFEILYEFQVGHFHIGPVLEYSYAKNDNHVMLGLHLGYSF